MMRRGMLLLLEQMVGRRCRRFVLMQLMIDKLIVRPELVTTARGGGDGR